jgi:hypothetical protein
VLRRHRARLLSRKGVIAVDVGLKIRDGKVTRVPAIRVHVRTKIKPEGLTPRRRLPKSIDGVAVDVLRGGFVASGCSAEAADLRGWHDPLIGGIGIGTLGTGLMGTAACVVIDDADRAMLLTAAHIIEGGTITQPPASDSVIGRTGRRERSGQMDAGLVELEAVRSLASGVDGVGVPRRVLDITDADLQKGLRVFMVGACSGQRFGTVTSRETSIPVDYDDGRLYMRDQLHIAPESPGATFNSGGDSGALVFTADGQAVVGLAFAASSPDESDPEQSMFGIATPIRRVLERLGVAIMG